MTLPITPPVPPMLARLVRALPRGDFLYEPKWDGFRALVFRDGDEVGIQSRHGRPLARYFPELVDGFVALPAERFVLDGEIVLFDESGSNFPALMARLDPTPPRVERLRRETPTTFVACDLLSAREEALPCPVRAAAREMSERFLSP